MSPQRYERVANVDDDTEDHATGCPSGFVPTSPPPSFKSRNSSRRPSHDDAHENDEVNDAFDAPSDDDSDDNSTPHDQQRLVRSSARSLEESLPPNANSNFSPQRPAIPQRRVTEISVFAEPTTPAGRVYGGGSTVHDGVFANLNAKPTPGDELEEKPPTYEQAAADATPPYWETTVLSPYSTTGNPDDVFVDGLMVGSLFSFVWNALISMSFQLIGFLLTYLLHTTHAAKHGSRAGLGITLIQYGFQMRYAASQPHPDQDVNPGRPEDAVPDDPNSHDFDPNEAAGGAAAAAGTAAGLSTGDWVSYVLMIVGWFILIRAVSDYVKARRQEELVRSSPDRGLGVAVVAEGESPERSV